MRVLLAATSTLPERMGGSERVIWELARALTAFLSFGTLYVPSLLLARAAARAAIARWGADVVHAHQAVPGLAVPAAALAYTFYGPWQTHATGYAWDGIAARYEAVYTALRR